MITMCVTQPCVESRRINLEFNLRLYSEDLFRSSILTLM